ncbi:hypothetical protein F2P79_001871 [Pimephales promelas]|nr:hypothetical protein F2P79_001871 [Pimephales promelas]
MSTARGCSPVMSPDGGCVGTCPPISTASSLPPYSSSPSVPTCRRSVRQLQVPPCVAGLQLCRQPAQHLCVLWERDVLHLNTATGFRYCPQASGRLAITSSPHAEEHPDIRKDSVICRLLSVCLEQHPCTFKAAEERESERERERGGELCAVV